MIPVVSITLFFGLFYVMVVGLLSLGIKRLKCPEAKSPRYLEAVSVVVPFRNEAAGLPLLIDDLSVQSYPQGKFSVIFINDHSTDDSRLIVDSLIREKSGFICLDLPEGKTGKKEALFQGISNAGTKWIIQTDADCRLGPDFISLHMAFLEERPSDLVAGIVTTAHKRGGFLETFDRLDMLSMVGAGAGSFHYGKPLMCNGANLLYSKDLYYDTREFDPSEKIDSGDDMFLMIGARKLGRKLSFSLARGAMVITEPASGIGSMIDQRARWGSKSLRYKMFDIQAVATLVSVTNLLVLITPVWMIIFPGCWLFLLPILLLKSLTDFLLLWNITGITGQRRSLRSFIPVSLIYYFYLPAVLTSAMFKKKMWKERNG